MSELTKGQQLAVQGAVKDFYNGEKLIEIDGLAGTGKTHTAYQIFKELHLDMSQVLCMAYTGAASLVMRSRGMTNACTIHSALYELVEVPDYNDIDNQFGIPRKHLEFKKRDYISPNIKVMFIDEASMVPKSMVEDIMSFGIPVIATGDLHQLPPVGDEPGFLTGSKVYHLTEIMRQAANNPIVYLANRVIEGLPIHNGTYGSVLVINNDEVLPQMYGYSDIVLSGTNRVRDAINMSIRQLAGFNSELPRYGERLICRQNNWNKCNEDNISLVNGLIGTVISNAETLEKYDKSKFNLDFLPDRSCVPFFRLKANYEYFVSNHEHRNAMKNMRVNYDRGEFFEYAYCITVHLSQGNEFSKGMYIENYVSRPQMQQQLNYTAITRFKDSMIYVRQKPKYYGFTQQNKKN